MSKFTSRIEAAGLATVATLSLVGGAETVPQQDRATAAREAIAHRFGSCAITGITYDTSHPTHKEGGLRDMLTVDIAASETPAAVAAAKTYEKDDTVFWQKPFLTGAIVRSDGHAYPYADIIMTDGFDGHTSIIADHNPRPFGEFLPRRYPDGTQAAFYAVSVANTWPKDGIHETDGYTYCGSLTVKNGTFKIDTAATQPNVTVEMTHPQDNKTAGTRQVIIGK